MLSASRMREHAGSRFDVLDTHGSRLPISEKSAYSRRAACVSMRVLVFDRLEAQPAASAVGLVRYR